ncbi:MAG: MBL fold metallo-hydrolase [Acidaminobacter sp.]|uniref:MBL fold metallo-hydrolase n=1 Tax=Acidaminobacter sp. TaxID=1872102 RepID=UPI001381A9C6|nr:MBL fold metallo-hydrolase [Acidaminobacter sp.]MZQ96068.1 MBL fold metallo-hydrolase [Acidaminobacter sp.]
MHQLEEGFYTFPIPLPNNPLKALNGYIILGDTGAVMIDTGFAMDACREAVYGALEALGVSFDKLTVVLTHLHSDHTGLAGELHDRGAKIIAGKTESWWIRRLRTEEMAEGFKTLIERFDLDRDGIHYYDNPGYKYAPQSTPELDIVEEGDRIEMGRFSLEVVDLPGHTPGLIGLYCRERGCLFGADHILDKITPNISYWQEGFDSLGVYLEMLEKARAMKLKRVYSAHRNVIDDPDRRIDELVAHHDHRLKEVFEIVGQGHETVREIAARMHWELRAAGWDEFPKAQKWFASSEAMAHLEYLHLRGRLNRTLIDGIYHYTHA